MKEKSNERNYWLNHIIKSKESKSDKYEYRLETVCFELGNEIFSALMKVTSKLNSRLFLILLTTLGIILKKYKQNGDITIGSPIIKQDIEALLINTLLIYRFNFAKEITFNESLKEMKQILVEATENQYYPVKTLMYTEGVGGGSEHPLFDIAILLENIHPISYLKDIDPDMLFSFRKTETTIRGEIRYNSARCDRAVINEMISQYRQVLEENLLHHEIDSSILNALADSETWGHDQENRTVLELFKQKTGEMPGAQAALVDGQYITYAELNRWSNQIMRVMKKKEVEPDNVVGILLDRSLERIAYMLAILKAGSAYLLIPPDTPTQLIIQMLAECEASFLLTGEKLAAEHSLGGSESRQGQQETRVTERRPQIKNFDGLPIPDRSLVDYEKYNRHIGQALVKYALSIQGTRGCPYRCAYCHRVWPKTHAYRSAENIFEEVQIYYNMGVRRFAFVDDIFNLKIKNSRKFFELVIEKGLKLQLFFPNGMRGDILTEDYIDLMVEAGLTNLALALETASPRMQQFMSKKLNIEKLRKNLEYICIKYPHIILDLCTMHGFPTETEEEAMITLNFLKSIRWIHFPYVNILKISHNTDMVDLALRSGISREAIDRSEHLAAHDIPETIPFKKSFTMRYKTIFLQEYFFLKERLLHVLPHQMKVLSEDELVQKYNSYLPTRIDNFVDLLQILGISKDELAAERCCDEKPVENFNSKLHNYFTPVKTQDNALKILLLDITQFFSDRNNMLYNVVDAPLGLMYLLTYLNKQLDGKIKGKIAKAHFDFDSYEELKNLLEDFNPDVIGVRSLTFFKDFFHQVVAKIREWGFNGPLITGGPYATSNFDIILHDSNIDIAVIGEGEETFFELITKILENNGKLPGNKVLEEIRGIVYSPGIRTHGKQFQGKLLTMEDIAEKVPGESGEDPGVPVPQEVLPLEQDIFHFDN